MPFGLAYPDWSRERHDWPHSEHSRFVECGGHHWHVQRFGTGPRLLLLHGTAASGHSFADLAEHLADTFEILIVDLPGHGFTRSPGFSFASPSTVARDLSSLLRRERFLPDIIAGHSAGAVAAIELALQSDARPTVLVAINGAFRPFAGLARLIAPGLAKMLYVNPLPAVMVARAASDPARIRSMAENTGSILPERNIHLYTRLLRYSGHVSGALSLMAGWDLEHMEEKFRSLSIRTMVIVGERDKAVSPDESARVIEGLPHAVRNVLAGCGHLAHEERPAEVAALIEAAARDAGLSSGERAEQETTA